MLDTLSTVKRHNPAINAIVTLQEESGLTAQAKEADRKVVTSALHGIPIALKELLNV